MTENTINNDMTMGGPNGTLLAGRYRVVCQLGQGGMGSVWLAEDTKLDGHKVAIKMLPSVLVNNKRAYAQVKAEALVSLNLSHPNIVAVRAFEEENGNPFLVMDYIDGQTLDDHLAEKGKLTEEETVKLLKPVAAALDYAHTQGVVHRDVKPGNVMIRKDGTPFVLDFGIAREIQETMTRVTGKLSSGTLLYMSPEQLNGDAPKPAQDIYSFAAMAYECLKGEPPFSRGQVEFQILNKEPEPLSGGSALTKTILRGLAKVPGARPLDCKCVVTPIVISSPRPQQKSPLRNIEIPKEDVRFIPPRDRPKFGPPKEAVPAVEQKRSNRKVWVVVSVFVAVGCVLALSKWTAPDVSRREGTAQTFSPQSVAEQKTLADNARVEALVRMETCRRINKGDGFGEKVAECENGLVRAQAEYDLKRWENAAKSYDEVVRQCATVIELGKARDQARNAAAEMGKRARAAKEAEADHYAKARFDAAKELMERARREFGEMNFEAAANSHRTAGEQFEKAVGEAKEGKVRQAQEDAERQRQAKEMERQRQAEMARRAKWRQEGQSFTIGPQGVNMKMIWCPPGEFTMGSSIGERGRNNTKDESSNAEHQRCVRITKGFWMGETEVTQGQWRELTKGEGIVEHCRQILEDPMLYRFPNIRDGRMEYKWITKREWLNAKAGIDPRDMCGDVADNIPMYYVDWYSAVEYCRKLTEFERRDGAIPDGYEYRLPTRAEWEYACRAGSTTSLPCGLEIDAVSENNCPALDKIAWYSGNSSVGFGNGRGWVRDKIQNPQYAGQRAAPRVVKTRRANDWGIYDMLGNVSEWCCDYSGGSNKGGDDPLGAEKGFFRACPGGGFFSGSSVCRPACSFVAPPTRSANDVGFRVVLAQKFDGYPYGADITLVRSSASTVGKADVDGTKDPVVRSKTVLLPNGVPIEMVWCGPSVFEVRPGVSQERKGFWIAKYELTQRQWKSVMRDNPSEFQNDTLPVENLSWNDCSRFLSALNARSSYKFRLPMGSEWEYAARGGPKGEILMPPDDFAWWGRNSDDLTHVGGSKKSNALGLYDVLGNVWEWCADMGSGKNYGKRELRGGSFCNNNRKWIDAKTPMYSDQDVAGRGAGLRLVCDDL